MKTLRPWRTTPHLYSTNPKTFTSESEATCWCLDVSWFGAPHLIFIEGSHLLGWVQQLFHLKPTLWTNEELPHRRSMVLEPMGRRPTCAWICLPSPLAETLIYEPLCPWLMTQLEVGRFVSLVGPPIHLMLAWRHMIGWCFAPWIEGCDFPSISAKNLHS